MFPMTITIHNAQQLNAVLASMDPSAVPAKVAVEVAVASSTKETVVTNGPSSTTGQIDSSPQSAAAAPEPAPEKPTAAPVAAGVTAPISYPEFAGKFTRFGQVKGRPAALEILKEYGVDNLKKVPEDKWSEILVKIDAALGA
jgi:hypothetical protein